MCISFKYIYKWPNYSCHNLWHPHSPLCLKDRRTRIRPSQTFFGLWSLPPSMVSHLHRSLWSTYVTDGSSQTTSLLHLSYDPSPSTFRDDPHPSSSSLRRPCQLTLHSGRLRNFVLYWDRDKSMDNEIASTFLLRGPISSYSSSSQINPSVTWSFVESPRTLTNSGPHVHPRFPLPT